MKKSYVVFAALLPLWSGATLAQSTAYSLVESKQLALQNNVKVRTSTLEIQGAEAQQKKIRVANYPSVSAIAAGVYSPNDLVSITTPPMNLAVEGGAGGEAVVPSFTYSGINTFATAAVTATQPLYAGGQIRTGNKLAALQVEVTKDQLTQAQDEVTLTTEQKYYQIVALNEKLRTLAANEKLLKGIFKQVNDNYKSGLVVHNDVTKVQRQLNQLALSEVELNNARQLAVRDLCQYMGVPYDANFTVTDTNLTAQSPQSLYKEPTEAVKTRPEYQLLQRNTEAEKLQTRRAQGQYLPQVAVGASAYSSKVGDTDASGNGLFFGTVSIPISGRFEAKHSAAQRQVREKITQSNARNSTELLELQIQQRWLNLQAAYKRVQVTDEAVAQTNENLIVNQDTYKNGLSTLNDLLEAQAQRQEAADERAEAYTAFQVSQTAYKLATGQRD
ncbi:TolC family protein [Hymenobacter sp.]|jgi:outer membrane protein TolC|uniref:TolC family protein n=1 Tax=Hymenobacter sp. TaxID=1898978 RepID=UPI002ED8357C